MTVAQIEDRAATLRLSTKRLRCAIYLRMSLDRELGIERQREDCWPLCERLGWEGIEYIDNDKSATKKDIRRPAYDRMLKDIEAGEIDAIICWHTDRLYRLMRDLLPLIDLVKAVEQRRGHWIPIETVQAGLVDLSTDSGRMTAKIQAAVSEHEGERRTARQKRGLQQVAEKGRGWGSPMFGFAGDAKLVDEETGQAKPGWNNAKLVPEEAEAIRQAYKDLLSGSTLYSIAKGWNEQGFRTRARVDRPEGNPWNGTTVRRVLDNPKCAGLRTIGTGKDREILYKDGKPVRGDWPAIVDEETWGQAHYILNDPSRRTNAAQVRKYLLGGILRCGSCDRGLGSARNSRGHAVYKCKNWQFCHNGVVRRQDGLDDWVRYIVVKKMSERDWTPPGSQISVEAARELHEEFDRIQQRKDGLVDKLTDELIDERDYRIQKARLEEKLEAIKAQLKRSAKSRIFDPFIGLSDPAKVAKVFDDMDIDRQRTLLEALFEKIVVNPLGATGWAARKIPVGTGIDVHWN